MNILNFGSLNIDYVYQMDSFVQPGETKSCMDLMINPGGKGLNQSIAASKAGNQVFHAGFIGRDGNFLVEKLKQNKVNVSLMEQAEGVSGHAIIQVESSGQNCIILYGGTNQMLTESYIDTTLERFGNEGLVMLQNETNLIGYIITKSHEKGLKVAMNVAPATRQVSEYPLQLLDWLIVNEIEAEQIAGDVHDEDLLSVLSSMYPNTGILLTLGKKGARCYFNKQVVSIGAYNVKAVDTTAAGDTFTGYFLYGILNNYPVSDALELATAASALCVQKMGASDSVPLRSEVQKALLDGSLGNLGVIA